VKKQDAVALTREAEALGNIYGAGATFTDRLGKVVTINSPGQFFRLADAAGRTKDITVGRYKGLGEMNPDELKETTLDPANRSLLQIRLRDAQEADDIFKTLMSEEVEERRQFIVENSKLAEVDL
jgi:DNA gyrase subunit B